MGSLELVARRVAGAALVAALLRPAAVLRRRRAAAHEPEPDQADPANSEPSERTGVVLQIVDVFVEDYFSVNDPR